MFNFSATSITDNPVIRLCIEGTQAEFAGKPGEASRLYWQAWESAKDDFEACVAAHYVARFQETPEDRLRWNLEALKRAEAAQPDRVKDFFPSLYVNLGHSYELLGNRTEADRYLDLAGGLGDIHRFSS